MNTTQRALKYLAEVRKPVRKDQIAKAIQASPATLSASLADLSRNYHIKQSKGFYVITPKGKEAIANDPELTGFAFRKPTPSSQIIITLPTQAIENSLMCHSVIEQMAALLSDAYPYDDEYLPFVLIWLRKNGYNLPDFKFKDDAASQPLLIKATDSFFTILAGNDVRTN